MLSRRSHELDEDDADVARHREQHLAEVLRLLLLARRVHGILPSLVTPSTRNAISLPNSSPISSTVARGVLDGVVSRPAHTLATSSFSSAMTCATASGCVTYGSPDLRVWPSCACAANS